MSWRAIWVCEKLSEIHPGWFILLYDEIIQRLIDCTHDGSKRLLLSILYNIPIPTPISVDLLNYCLDHMLSPQESIGVQALSIRIAYLLCRKEPELLQELQLILENAELDFYSTGVRTTVRNTLKKIRATKGREEKKSQRQGEKKLPFVFYFRFSLTFVAVKTKGCPDGLRLYPRT